MTNYPKQNRFRIFREHKYIFYLFSNVLQQLATANLADSGQVTGVKDGITNLMSFLNSHTIYEESRISTILVQKGSEVFKNATAQHSSQAQSFIKILSDIDQISATSNIEDRFFFGYKLHLDLRKIFSNVLDHLDYEERMVMPELQRLLSDDEIKSIDHISYQNMLPKQMVHMMQTLIPHLNSDDRFVILTDMQEAQPLKFSIAWDSIKSLLTINEINLIERRSLREVVSDAEPENFVERKKTI